MNELYRFLDGFIKTQSRNKKYLPYVVFLSKYLYTSAMTITQLIKNAGSQSELARLLGVTRGAVWIWKRDGIPKHRIWQLKLIRPEWF